MNAFEQLAGKTIIKVLLQYAGKEYIDQNPLALFLQTETDSGVQISNVNLDSSVLIGHMHIEDVLYNFEIDYIVEPLQSNKLAGLVGKTIGDVKIGEFVEPKISGDSFVVRQEEFAGIIIEIDQHTITCFGSSDGVEVYFDSDIAFPARDSWVLK